MSCGNPHETPCTEVLSLVYVFIDGEIDAPHQVEVTAHLLKCPPCGEEYAVERKLKERVRQACECETIPDEVRMRIVAEIRQVSITYRYE
jgi:mycothiol system anti-sigma-R factor